MAIHSETVLRRRVCLSRECCAVFFLCSHCDRGQRYCSLSCRQRARLDQRRSANRRHQQSPEGRLDHRDRQREYRQRRAQARVTDQGSLFIPCSTLSECGSMKKTRSEGPDRSGVAALPLWPHSQRGSWLRCRVCGRQGRFIDQSLRVPPPKVSRMLNRKQRRTP